MINIETRYLKYYGIATPHVAYDFFRTYQASEWKEPERSLLASVLVDGVICYRGMVGHGKTRDENMRLAEQWIFDDGYPARFTFRFVCDHLGINTEGLRKDILKLDRNGRPSKSLKMGRSRGYNMGIGRRRGYKWL